MLQAELSGPSSITLQVYPQRPGGFGPNSVQTGPLLTMVGMSRVAWQGAGVICVRIVIWVISVADSGFQHPLHPECLWDEILKLS